MTPEYINKSLINKAFSDSSSKLHKAVLREVAMAIVMDDAAFSDYVRRREREDAIQRTKFRIAELRERLAWEEKTLKWYDDNP